MGTWRCRAAAVPVVSCEAGRQRRDEPVLMMRHGIEGGVTHLDRHI